MSHAWQVIDEAELDAGEVALELGATPAPRPRVERPAAARVGLERPAPFTPSTQASAFRLQAALQPFLLTTFPLIATDIASLLACGMLGGLVADWVDPAAIHGPGRAAPLVLLPLVLAYLPGGLYPGVGLHPVVEFATFTKLNAISFLATAIACLVTGSSVGWDAFFLTAWAASLFLVPLGRILARRGARHFQWWGYPAVVISSGDAARKTIRSLLDCPRSGLRPYAVIDPTAVEYGSIEGLPVVSGLGGLSRADGGLGHAPVYGLVALPHLSREQVRGIIHQYRSLIPHLLIVSNVEGMPTLWRDSRDCGGGLTGMEVRNGLMLAGPRFVKRAIDLSLTTMTFVGGFPLMALIGLLVRLTSRGGMFFGHTRIGHGGERFTAWKFRTMRVDGAELLARHLDADPAARAEWETTHKLRDDPRVTPIGRFLRKSSLDELPQLWNVLNGQMSLVGPRPIVDDEVIKYGETFAVYKEVRPGVTGLWQVSGRNDTTYDERVSLDDFYVRNWSPWLDLHILVRTISVIVTRNGAY